MRKLIILLSLGFMLTLSATVINIPADYSTIQEALDLAVESDTLLVAAGTYYENIQWPNQNGIKLIGSGAESCFLDGSSIGSVIRLENITASFDETTLIEGFTIQNGYAHGESSNRFGGGIYLMSSPINLKNLIISDNSAKWGGGIICFNYSHAYLENVIITNNSADFDGGGLLCKWTSHVVLSNVVISGNEATTGGGIAIMDISEPEVSLSLIYGNTATYGGGVFIEKDGTDFINCTITHNSAYEAGGGVLSNSSGNVFENSILWFNTPQQLVESAEVIYSNFELSWPGSGNIDSDPLFVDADNGDYHLSATSPCIDSGNPLSPLDPDSTQVDMGCFYYDSTLDSPDIESPVNEFQISNYPNPFNPSTKISFELTTESTLNTAIEIYNIKGQSVVTLSDPIPSDRIEGRQTHTITWNGTDQNNNQVASGIYFLNLKVGNEIKAVKKCLLLK